MASEIKNIHIIDAPAGSGKTYSIHEQISKFLIDDSFSQVLAITYTNRAAEQIKLQIDSEKVYVSTIHAFINDLINPFFKKKEVVDFFLEEYENKIKSMIDDDSKSGKTRNKKYKDHYGDISFEEISKNISEKGLYYGETNFSAYYYGGLGHNDLLVFADKMLNKFPKLRIKINQRFRLIIIDEYQDTSESILNLFFQSVLNKSVELYLYGDTMQQIYQEYSPSMTNRLNDIGINHLKAKNYRSNSTIINILNKIDGGKFRIQSEPENSKVESSSFPPQVFFVDNNDIDNCVERVRKANPNTLVLYVFSKERFRKIGAINLYEKYVEIYPPIGQIQAKNVLMEFDPDNNPDDLMNLLLSIQIGSNLWKKGNYGKLITWVNSQKKIFDDIMKLRTNSDKEKINHLWQKSFNLLNSKKLTISEVLNDENLQKIINKSVFDKIFNNDVYSEVLGIKIKEFMNLIRNSNNFSTQHGVKGESHDSIIFVAEDSSRIPHLKMYDFLRLWSKYSINIDDFEKFAIDYAKAIREYDIKKNSPEFKRDSHSIFEKFENNFYFQQLEKNDYEKYFKNQTVTNAKEISKRKVWYTLAAYKLFYVGCSRAKRNLTLIIDKNQINGFEDDLHEKLTNIGFIFPEYK